MQNVGMLRSHQLQPAIPAWHDSQDWELYDMEADRTERFRRMSRIEKDPKPVATSQSPS